MIIRPRASVPANIEVANSVKSVISSAVTALRGNLARRIDWPLLWSVLAIMLTGAFTLWSATENLASQEAFYKQVIFYALGIPTFVVFLLVDPRMLANYRVPIFIFNVALLLAVLIIGKELKGAQRWIDLGFFQLQPSEPAKLLLIITLSAQIAYSRETHRTVLGVLGSFLHVFIPFLLVAAQPDLGTATVFLSIWLGISIASYQRYRYLAIVFGLMIGLFGLGVSTGFIKKYQLARVTALLDGGYHSEVAQRAIGSGGIPGTGFLRGPAKEAALVPEQTTDFVFTVMAEEGGFVGSLLTVGAFSFFLWRVWLVVAGSTTRLFRYLSAGIFVVFSFHICVNLLMVVGLFPIVGIPLPFWSAGGSALMLNMAMLGLLFNLRSKEKNLVF